MGLIARLCMNCNGRGTVPALDAHGRDTGQSRDCSYCEGCGEVVAYTTTRGGVSREKVKAALETVPFLHDISDGALDYLHVTLLDAIIRDGGQ